MSSVQQQQQNQPLVLPRPMFDQGEDPGAPSDPRRPQIPPDFEAQMVYKAALDSVARQKMAKAFQKYRILRKSLMWKNYFQRFQKLLHLEELQQQSEFDKFFQHSVPLFEHRDLFGLRIPGLSMSPSQKLSGCCVLVTQRNGFSSRYYRGWVQYVAGELVFLKFKDDASLSELVHYQGSNPEQSRAIQHILATTAKPAPYLVFGPPGTGKTVTLVGAIKQILRRKASCNILACAPTNNATDLLCEKLCEIFDEDDGRHKLYRLYALSRRAKNVPQNRKFSCNLDENNFPCVLPAKEHLMEYQIMVTTLKTAARLVTGGIPSNFYSYIFVDEAGQATETECIIPIAGLHEMWTCQIVLAGDPKQLGPVVTSRMANKYGFGLSLLERLMRDFDIYKRFNGYFVTKLLRNYRSHPSILKVPNELFYEGELQPYASEDICCVYCNWDYLPKKGFPVVFHGVAGSDESDANCTSVYNTAEVEVMKKYLKALISHLEKKGVTEIGPNQIGIITPYTKQVEKIQEALRTDKDLMEKNLENILVGTVEKFQGRESQVIMVSAVRSNPRMTDENYKFTLGFVKDEKRFNVAMTRAQALLIVFGDPRALRTDPVWNKFIQYCYEQGGYRGITVSSPEVSDQLSLTLREE
ncbi:putative helicase mov-10-B.2 [Halichoeres trimaculatus]|uniref:putative helicase mov-10-B.2 n=1 Tax=Halichoeres trimaculatus TaxID=147232 RepID=UPI003D9F0193